MLGALEDGNQRLRLSGLRRFINEHLTEAEVADSAIKCRHTRCTDDICISQDLFLSLSLQVFQLLFIFFSQFTLVFFFEHELLHLCEVALLQVFDLLVQAQIVHVRAD